LNAENNATKHVNRSIPFEKEKDYAEASVELGIALLIEKLESLKPNSEDSHKHQLLFRHYSLNAIGWYYVKVY